MRTFPSGVSDTEPIASGGLVRYLAIRSRRSWSSGGMAALANTEKPEWTQERRLSRKPLDGRSASWSRSRTSPLNLLVPETDLGSPVAAAAGL